MKLRALSHTFTTVLLLLGSMWVFGQNQQLGNRLNQRLANYEKGTVSLTLVEQIDLYNRLSNYYKYRNPDSLYFFAEKALKLNSPIVSQKAFVKSTIRLGDYHSDKGEKKEASYYYDQARLLITDLNDPIMEISLLQGEALNYFFNYRSEKWHACLEEAIKISKANNLDFQHAVQHHIKGYLFYTHKMYKEAEEEQLKAVRLFEQIGKWPHVGHAKSNLALNSLDWGKKEDFLKYNAEAMDILLRYPDPLWERRTYHSLSKYYLAEKDYKKALKWNESAEKLLKNITLERETLENYCQKSMILAAQGNYEQAHPYAQKTEQMAAHLKDTLALIKSYEVQHQIAAHRGQDKEKMEYLFLAHQIKAEFNENAKNSSILFLKERLEFENQKAKIRQLNAMKAQNQDRLIRIAIIILFGLSLIWLQLFFNRRSQRRLRKELEAINSSKNKLFSVVSHDLVHPINKLKENLALYKDNKISEDQVLNSIPKLQAKVEHSSFTLNNLLYWAQSQMSGIQANPKNIDLKDRVALSCDRFMGDMQDKVLDVACEIPKNLKVHFDVNHLDVIVRNMVSNAVKYTPPGGKIRFRAYEEDDQICFELQNDGNPIPSEILPYLDKNSLGDFQSTSFQDTKTGVGLKVVKELVDLNFGQIHYGYSLTKGNLVLVKMPKAMSLQAVVSG